jgi:hypothetical protein
VYFCQLHYTTINRRPRVFPQSGSSVANLVVDLSLPFPGTNNFFDARRGDLWEFLV